MKKITVLELLSSFAYSLCGSLGFNCILQWWAMNLDNHLNFPYRRPFTLVTGMLALLGCISLFLLDLQWKTEWKWWQRLLCRVGIVVITFVPFVILWAWTFELGDLLIGTD